MIEPLTLDQLRVLVAVAEAGSFSAESRQLTRVQSAVSQCIQALENTLQLQLFDRSGKWPKLTEAGQAVVSDARQLLRGAEALRSRAGSVFCQVGARELRSSGGQGMPSGNAWSMVWNLRSLWRSTRCFRVVS
jgi:DNA-binding transcriptional LysR family regulator